jgi:hypothetical protein
MFNRVRFKVVPLAVFEEDNVALYTVRALG